MKQKDTEKIRTNDIKIDQSIYKFKPSCHLKFIKYLMCADHDHSRYILHQLWKCDITGKEEWRPVSMEDANGQELDLDLL